jgi:perosamine synthetase
MNDFIPVNIPKFWGKEKDYLIECIDSGWISSEGPFVNRFEESFSRSVGRKHGIAVCNGSAALELAVAMLDLQPGDEVILPTFTIISCGNALIRAGVKPVLVDCDPETWNMDVNSIRDKVTSKTKGIMVVHIYGLPCDMNPILEIADDYNLKIIEDAAEMHGQTYENKPCGSFGHVSTFSFYPNKHITTGEGGMVVVDDDFLAERGKSLRNLSFGLVDRYRHEEMGWNFRMTNLQAALGLAQLEFLDQAVARKHKIGEMYYEGFKDLEMLQLPVQKMSYAVNIYWVYGIILKEIDNFDITEFISKLNETGVGNRRFFVPLHDQPVYKKQGFFFGENYPNSMYLSKRGLYIPSGIGTTNEQVLNVIEIIRNILLS